MKYSIGSVLILALLAGCTGNLKAPVIERTQSSTKPVAKSATQARKPVIAPKAVSEKPADWRPDSYIVKKGDTLYAIGLEYGFDYKDIANWNGITPPAYTIRVGQALKLKAPASAGSSPVVSPAVAAPAATEGSVVSAIKTEAPPQAKPLDEPTPAAASPETKADAAKPVEKPAEKPLDDSAVEWGWPAVGKILAKFSDSNKGLDIAGSIGQPVLAAASGKVVYSGNGLRGYGKMVIIKHNTTYLSAYAHNSQIVVKEGQDVVKGQKIAEMGNSDADSIMLHFEIRKLGQPIDPEKFLPANATMN
ncbi:MAG TPA: peptidoglycan DD-metalloendopeptidase family protein [Methylophilaceae bacterium]|jgi:lipoprotein NlpD